jgi:hypothetical protein
MGVHGDNELTHAVCNRQFGQVKFGDELLHQFDGYWSGACHTCSVDDV